MQDRAGRGAEFDVIVVGAGGFISPSGECLVSCGQEAAASGTRIYEERIRRDPLIRAVLGPRVEYLEPLRMAPLLDADPSRATSFRNACLRDAEPAGAALR